MLKVESLEVEDLLSCNKNTKDKELVSESKLKPKDEADNITQQRRREAEMIYGSADDMGDATKLCSWEQEDEYYTITKMNPGVRDTNRVNIFLDGHFVFSLDVTQVVEFGLKVQQKITPERLTELRKASEFGKLYQRTLEWALTRPHSIRETRDYLRRRQYKRKQLNRQRARDEKKPLAEIDDEVAQLVIDRLIEKKFLNDQKFAEFYVENRYLRKGISHKRLRMELMQKGVDAELINAALEKVPRDEDEEIKKVIAKKRTRYDDFQLVGYLVRQGFNFQQAKDAVAQSHTDWFN